VTAKRRKGRKERGRTENLFLPICRLQWWWRSIIGDALLSTEFPTPAGGGAWAPQHHHDTFLLPQKRVTLKWKWSESQQQQAISFSFLFL